MPLGREWSLCVDISHVGTPPKGQGQLRPRRAAAREFRVTLRALPRGFDCVKVVAGGS